jgi:hypothetical protein
MAMAVPLSCLSGGSSGLLAFILPDILLNGLEAVLETPDINPDELEGSQGSGTSLTVIEREAELPSSSGGRLQLEPGRGGASLTGSEPG